MCVQVMVATLCEVSSGMIHSRTSQREPNSLHDYYTKSRYQDANIKTELEKSSRNPKQVVKASEEFIPTID